MSSYDDVRQQYKPDKIEWLFVAESPPPRAEVPSSRHFYRAEPRTEDRLFVNTIKALYDEAAEKTEGEIEAKKKQWLRQFRADGCYMIEALEKSLSHKVTKEERQQLIKQSLPRLIERMTDLADTGIKILLIKSNVFEVAADPLKASGFQVINEVLIDYPGRFNQRRFREKLHALMGKHGWKS
jgi:hypothetical protein